MEHFTHLPIQDRPASGAETRLAETLARLEELRKFARAESVDWNHDPSRRRTHAAYAAEIEHTIAQAKR